jgi:hypothetical protein
VDLAISPSLTSQYRRQPDAEQVTLGFHSWKIPWRRNIMGRRLLLPSFIAVLATLALGQSNSRANLYVGYSFLSNDPQVFRAIGEGSYFSTGRANLNGWNVSGELKVFHWVGLVADFNGTYGSIPIRFIVMPPPTTG